MQNIKQIILKKEIVIYIFKYFALLFCKSTYSFVFAFLQKIHIKRVGISPTPLGLSQMFFDVILFLALFKADIRLSAIDICFGIRYVFAYLAGSEIY